MAREVPASFSDTAERKIYDQLQSAAAFSPSNPNILDAELQELRHQSNNSFLLSLPLYPIFAPLSLEIQRPLASRGRLPLIS